MPTVETWPNEVTTIKTDKGRETVRFKRVITTIEKFFPKYGGGYSFRDDTGTNDRGYKNIWSMSGEYNPQTGKRDPYCGPTYDEGQTVEVELSITTVENTGKIYNNVDSIQLGNGNPFDKAGDEPPPQDKQPAQKPAPTANDRDLHIRRAQALNLICAAMDAEQGPLTNAHYERWRQWTQRQIDALLDGEPLNQTPHPPWDHRAVQHDTYHKCRRALIDALNSPEERISRIDKGVAYIEQQFQDDNLATRQKDELLCMAQIFGCETAEEVKQGCNMFPRVDSTEFVKAWEDYYGAQA